MNHILHFQSHFQVFTRVTEHLVMIMCVCVLVGVCRRAFKLFAILQFVFHWIKFESSPSSKLKLWHQNAGGLLQLYFNFSSNRNIPSYIVLLSSPMADKAKPSKYSLLLTPLTKHVLLYWRHIYVAILGLKKSLEITICFGFPLISNKRKSEPIMFWSIFLLFKQHM